MHLANVQDPLARFMTTGEVADVLRTGESTIRLWCRQGRLESRKLGKKRLITRDSVTAMVDRAVTSGGTR
jgi:excisionase family DNA binding protein